MISNFLIRWPYFVENSKIRDKFEISSRSFSLLVSLWYAFLNTSQLLANRRRNTFSTITDRCLLSSAQKSTSDNQYSYRRLWFCSFRSSAAVEIFHGIGADHNNNSFFFIVFIVFIWEIFHLESLSK